jgi:hypothetical protein
LELAKEAANDPKRTVSELQDALEISHAVVVSLLFVAYSINNNSAVIQSSNDNFLLEICLLDAFRF